MSEKEKQALELEYQQSIQRLRTDYPPLVFGHPGTTFFLEHLAQLVAEGANIEDTYEGRRLSATKDTRVRDQFRDFVAEFKKG